jgi:hypothetical protein
MVKSPFPPACRLEGLIFGEMPEKTSCVVPGDSVTGEVLKTCAPCVKTVTFLIVDLTVFSEVACAAVVINNNTANSVFFMIMEWKIDVKLSPDAGNNRIP